jgi:Flp pilus assembly protein TadD
MIPRGMAKTLGLFVGLLLVAVVGLLWIARGWWARDKTATNFDPDDPRVIYTGPFRNIRPDVGYVGDAICTECHLDRAESYRQSAMGNSLVPIAQLVPEQHYDKHAHNPFDAFGCRLLVDRQGDHVWHRQTLRDAKGEPLITNAMEVQFVIGSGHRGHSYFTSVDGFVFQTPVSWYSQKAMWDASPGFATGTRRPIVPDCLYCHSNRVEPVAHSLNRYKEPIFRGHAIGCERCHGPGELHVRERQENKEYEGTTDYTIVNPIKLPAELREDVCQQCHLEGEGRVERPGRHAWDFRPGLPVRDYWSVFVPSLEPTGEHPAVSQVEQMYSSRCFQASAGAMGCITCHDPHEHVMLEDRDTLYRGKCIGCHEQKGCTVPVVRRKQKCPSDNCIDCHMPRFPAADIVHTAMTDHRILRAPGKVHPSSTSRQKRVFSSPLRLFREEELSAQQFQSPRELGIVVVAIARDKGKYREELPLALRLIERALVDHPRDLALWEHKGTSLVLRKERLPEALAAFETLLQLCPEHEIALSQAAFVNQTMEDYEAALPYWRRAVAISPEQENYRFNLGMTLSRLGRWQEARDACQEAVRLDPFSGRNRVLLAVCLHKTGDKQKAQEEFAKVRVLKPPEFEVLQRQFEDETRK